MAKLDECIKKKLIRKVIPSRDLALKMLGKASVLLEESQKSLDAGAPDSSVLMSYEVMLLSAKALLAKDGFREKSHYCIAVYITEEYADTKRIDRSIAEVFDSYRTVRHMLAYDAEFMTSEEDAKKAILFARRMHREVRKLTNAGGGI